MCQNWEEREERDLSTSISFSCHELKERWFPSFPFLYFLSLSLSFSFFYSTSRHSFCAQYLPQDTSSSLLIFLFIPTRGVSFFDKFFKFYFSPYFFPFIISLSLLFSFSFFLFLSSPFKRRKGILQYYIQLKSCVKRRKVRKSLIY